jgi:DNA-binding IclR family transcriptional regulator
MDPATRKYAVAAGLVALARSALRHNSFPKARAIAVEASGLDHMIVVALARSQSPLQLQVEIGSRFPALISATGRCIAAFGNYSLTEIKARFRSLQWESPPTLTHWLAEVQATRESGFAVDDGQYIRGVSIVAAPIKIQNGSVNALVVVGLSEQMRELGLMTVGRDLRQRASRLSNNFRDGDPAATVSVRK